MRAAMSVSLIIIFDMDAGEYTVEIIEGTPENLKCRSVFDIA